MTRCTTGISLPCSGKNDSMFTCIDQFGYYPDPGDCSKYYVCVFGDPQHESCTGGLYFSTELQTCDWPRNTKCAGGGSQTKEEEVHEVLTNGGDVFLSQRHELDSSHEGSSNYGVAVQTSPIKPPYQNPYNNVRGTPEESSHPDKSNYNPLYGISQVNPQDLPQYGGGIPSVVASNKKTFGGDLGTDRLPHDRSMFVKPVFENDGTRKSTGIDRETYYTNEHQKEFKTLHPIDHNNGHSKDPDTIPLLSTNNGHPKDPDTIPLLSTNNGHPKDPDTIPLLSTNNGHPKDPDTIPLLSNDDGHSQDVGAISPLASNNGHYKDPDVRFLASPPIPPPKRSKNHRPAYGPEQSLQGPGSIDAQFDTSPSIVSLSGFHNQPNYNYPIDKKSTSTRNSNAPGVKDVSIGNDPSQIFSYRNYDDPYQYNYEYYDDYEPTSPTPPYNVKPHKPSTTTTTANPPVVITSSPTQKSVNSTSLYPARPSPLYPTPVPLVQASGCNPSKCLAPDCRCGGSDIPGGLPLSETPQVVLLTFDDAINDLNFDLYKEIFAGRKNPNGCPIHGTFYISHEWTDYGQVQTLYSQGHEMASHTISHSYGEKFSKNKWFKEIQGQREILHLYGGVKMEDIRGMRAPFLQIGGNHMFEMLFEANFTYDSSMPVFENDPPFWPFTLDYTINNECMITPCPSESFPGLWEMAMVMWVDLKGGRCSMADACSNPQDEQGIVEFLKKNFNRHYNSNRAPLGLFYHSAWFTTAHHKKGFMKFLDEILSKGDVWLITNWQLIQWLRNPTPKSKLNNFEPWQCKRKNLIPPCHNPTVCNVWDQNGIRYMKTCQKCPSHYPWVGRTGYKKEG
ncbi:uncharacterized protein LOC106458349 isoform X2 [Limulus polyphemus]|uniref:Uncharacterized protein LOC106458349 isoform X2 n=1 Tax=Limulus polyphemus TaxID=6850 RepID=A0ABM1S9E0_LIMPO|nr:uncharacterized protein LOC106458349 isoform X2 [Limulus polyphemus]